MEAYKRTDEAGKYGGADRDDEHAVKCVAEHKGDGTGGDEHGYNEDDAGGL